MSTAPVPPDGGNPTDNDEAARQILDLLAEVGWVLHGWNDAGSLPRQVARRCAAFAAGRAAATPDPPDMTNMCEGESPDHKPGITPAASPDERLREALRDANEYLAQIADYSPSEVADAIDSVRAQIKDALAATDSRGNPDGASVPDQTRRIVVYDARCGRGGLDVPVGCTVGEAALLAAEMFGVRVGPNDRPSFGLRGTGLHASDPLPDDEDYELFVIGGTV